MHSSKASRKAFWALPLPQVTASLSKLPWQSGRARGAAHGSPVTPQLPLVAGPQPCCRGTATIGAAGCQRSSAPGSPRHAAVTAKGPRDAGGGRNCFLARGYCMRRGWDKSEEARLLGRRALFRAQVAREDCSSSSCVKAQRALAPPLLKLGEHFLENIPIVLRSPPLPSPFCERSTCSGSRPKDGAEGRCCQVRRLSLQLQLSRCSS